MTIKGPWDAKVTPHAKRQNELAKILPKQLQARELPRRHDEPDTDQSGRCPEPRAAAAGTDRAKGEERQGHREGSPQG